jgi:hypothetical protein
VVTWPLGKTCESWRSPCPRPANGSHGTCVSGASVWERPLRRSDLEALGEEAPDGPILGARVEHLGAKEALLANDEGVFFTTPHFDGYAAILARLDRIALEALEELVVEAWLARAPRRLARAYLDSL